jgi:hypothetical protein
MTVIWQKFAGQHTRGSQEVDCLSKQVHLLAGQLPSDWLLLKKLQVLLAFANLLTGELKTWLILQCNEQLFACSLISHRRFCNVMTFVLTTIEGAVC